MSLHPRSSNFNNPFQGRQRSHPYQQEDLNASDRDIPNTIDDFPTHGVTDPEVEADRGDAVIDFPQAYTDNTLNPHTNVTGVDLETHMTQMDNVNLNPEPVIDIATDQKLLEKAIKNTLFDVVQWNTIGLIFFAMLSMTVKIGISYLYVFVFLWIHNTYNIVMLSNRDSHPTDKGKVTLGVINNLLSAIFKVFLVIQIETRALLFSGPLAPILVFELLSSIVRLYYNRRYTVSTIFKIRLFFKLLAALQILLVCLKLDNLSHLGWRETFWVFWITVAITVGVSFALILMTLNKCCSYMFAEMEAIEVRGVFWLFLVLGGKTILAFTLVVKLLKVLESDTVTSSTLAPVLIASTCYCFFTGVYTIVYRKHLIEFFNRLAAIDLNAPMIDSDQEQDEKEKAAATAEPEKVDIPKFLTKSSSTYFRRATGDEVEVAKTKRKQKEDKKAAKSKAEANARAGVKLSKRRQNSVDYLKLRNMSQVGNTSTSPLNLLTVPETDADRTKTNNNGDWSNTSRFGLRTDKGKDLLLSMSDRNGVSGIIPSGLITSKTDRYINSARDNNVVDHRDKDYSPLTSNDSYLLGQISRDTDGQFSAFRKGDKNPDNLRNSPNFNLPTSDASPHLANPDNSPLHNVDVSPLKIPDRRGDEEGLELPTFNKHHRRINSNPNLSPNKMFSLFEAIESPKVRDSVRIEYDPPIISPKSDASQAVQCLICFDNPPDAVFMECGHGGVCYECSLEIWKATNECYLCRNKITQVLQIDLKAKVGDDVIKVLSSTQMVLYEEEAEA